MKINPSEEPDYFIAKMTVLYFALFACALASFWVGRYPVSPKTVFDIILYRLGFVAPYWEKTLETVVLSVRMPRIILAALVGGALSVSGASYQTLFKNPMVSPDILGVSAGAGFGAALAMVNNAMWWQVQISALLFSILAVFLTNFIGYVFARQEITVMVLAGVVISSLFQALLAIVKTIADPENALPSITFWLMGSLGRGSNKDVLMMLPFLVLSLALLFFFRYQINALAAGSDEAATLGVNVPLVKLTVIAAPTMMTVASVCIGGIIGWIGMVAPHISRMLAGADYPKLVCASFGVGGLFLLIIDDIVRGVPGVELPLGVLTALVGTPVFVALLSRVRKGWL
jgi:iron complex transport system permease protein